MRIHLRGLPAICGRAILVAAALMVSPVLCAQSTPDLTKAGALIKAGKAAEALKLLAPHEDAQAGNTAFDYLHGVAALEAGDAARATVALERVLIVDPNHMGARVDLGRAYLALGDTARARNEFNIALLETSIVGCGLDGFVFLWWWWWGRWRRQHSGTTIY